jgi:hypothetical protein
MRGIAICSHFLITSVAFGYFVRNTLRRASCSCLRDSTQACWDAIDALGSAMMLALLCSLTMVGMLISVAGVGQLLFFKEGDPTVLRCLGGGSPAVD